MLELQTLKGFLDNPIGKGTSILPNKELIVNDLKRRRGIMIDKGKKFDVNVYHNEVTDNYFFHVIVPSETQRDNTYDVVIQLSPPKTQTGILKPPTIDKYEARFFSNSPSFVFTYAYIMNSNGLLVKFLAKKYDSIVLRQEPVVKNPTGVILYEKSIVFAILTILDNVDYMSRAYLKSIKKPQAENVLFTKIRTSEKILEEIDKEKRRLGLVKREKDKKIKEEVSEKSRVLKKMTTALQPSTRTITAKKSTSNTSKQKTGNRVSAKKSTRK